MEWDYILRDKIRGSLVGGAAGDALGYPVEFMQEAEIFKKYGPAGIEAYDLDPVCGQAVISDDTQMTLFTANGLLFGMGRQKRRGISGDPRYYVLYAYLGWLHTQQMPYSSATRIPDDMCGWASDMLQDVPQLYVRRAPGMTCLEGLRTRKQDLENNRLVTDFIGEKINHSKGCGGVMRVAPLGLAIHFWDMDRLDMEGAQLAAITHTHPLGYIPAAVLTHIINRLVCGDKNLREAVVEARYCVAKLFAKDPHTAEMNRILDQAIELSENDRPDRENIACLGGGWVAEEALAISVYCSLRYPDDFSRAIIAAVNHSGDSDSTGAITGNIMGALLGYEKIQQKWKDNLELHDLILQIADRLYEQFR